MRILKKDLKIILTVGAAMLMAVSYLFAPLDGRESGSSPNRHPSAQSDEFTHNRPTSTQSLFVWPEEENASLEELNKNSESFSAEPSRAVFVDLEKDEEDGTDDQLPISDSQTVPDHENLPTENEKYYLVAKVVDGDTIDVEIEGKQERIRLVGLNTPESVDPRRPVECWGREASAKAAELLSGRQVKIEKDSTQDDRDKYGRLLRYVFRDDGLLVNKEMIALGYGYEYTYKIPYEFQAEFKEAQAKAKAGQLGLWSPATCDGRK